MALLPLVMAPDPIFKKKAAAVTEVNDSVRAELDNMLETMLAEHGIGIAGNMVGILKQLVVIQLQGQSDTFFMVNPEIIAKSQETQVVEEGSLCFLGIAAPVERPKKITVQFLDYHGKPQTLEAEGLLSSCIQHEVDYLHGLTFLDHLSPTKRDMLTRKMLKTKKRGFVPHVHTAACNH